MTQSTKTRYFRDLAPSPEDTYGTREAVQYPDPPCELQVVEALEPVVENETDTPPPIDLLAERPMKWIAARCPFGERRQYSDKRLSDGEADSADCLH